MMYICIARIGMGLINLVAQNKVLLTSLKVKAYKILVFFKRSKNYSRGQVREQKTKQKSLNEPQEAGGRVVDPFVAVEIRERKW